MHTERFTLWPHYADDPADGALPMPGQRVMLLDPETWPLWKPVTWDAKWAALADAEDLDYGWWPAELADAVEWLPGPPPETGLGEVGGHGALEDAFVKRADGTVGVARYYPPNPVWPDADCGWRYEREDVGAPDYDPALIVGWYRGNAEYPKGFPEGALWSLFHGTRG
jgi:hypothetical protein